ncbi:MAG: hypothetical protein QOD75_602 [Blastocatellia bacterium]|jgi:hypothetical protein|nr:hypothetical protein [Blastocatellia bacterium]
MYLAHPKSLLKPNPSSLGARSGLLAFLLLLVCAGASQATTVTQYRERLHSAVLILNANAVRKEPAEVAGMSAAFDQVRNLLPIGESVEADGRSIPVNNEWLHVALKDCEQTPATGLRAEKAARITERLEALSARLNEFEAATSSDRPGKEQNKARLEEILRRSEYQKKTSEGGALARLWRRLMKWLSSLLPQSQPLSPGSERTAAIISKGAQIFVVALALAVIAYVAWKLAPRFLRSRKSKKKTKREARIVLGETLDPDQTAGGLMADAESLARAGDLRAAIRKAYIALLCELGDRKLIRLAQHKTNRDYLSAVREIAPLHEEMGKLTRSFESHWYGFVPATENEWISFRNGYQRAVSHQQ